MAKEASCATRIVEALSLRNMKQSELCALTGIPKSAMSQYCSGAFTPKQDRTALIARALDVNEAWLMGFDVPSDRDPTPAKPACSIVPVRYLGEVAAGFDHIAYEEYEYLNVPEEWLHGHPASDYFAMRVTGSSMYPEYRDGDEILCLHCDDMGRSGRVGVFVHGEEATLKKIEYVHGEDWVDLVPINPEYETKRIEGADLEHCRVIGRAVRLIRTINQ